MKLSFNPLISLLLASYRPFPSFFGCVRSSHPWVILFASVLVVGCNDNAGTPEVDAILSPGQIVSMPTASGRGRANLLHVESGQEYIISVVSTSSQNYPNEEQLDLLLQSTVDSAVPPFEESAFLQSLPATHQSPSLESMDVENHPPVPSSQPPVPCPNSRKDLLLPDTYLASPFFVPMNPGNFDVRACEIRAIPIEMGCTSHCPYADISLIFSKGGDRDALDRERLEYLSSTAVQNLLSCIRTRVRPLQMQLFGQAPDINRVPLTILLTALNSPYTNQTVLGLFDFADLFKRSDYKPRFQNSNERALVYIHYTASTARNTDAVCGTVLHELQHLINFYSKTLKPRHIIDRLEPVETAVPDLQFRNFQELYGINEGLSTLAESFMGLPRHFQDQFRIFLYRMGNAPLTTTRQANIENIFNDAASRGANASLIDYWVARKGGYTFNAEGEPELSGKGLDFYRSIVTSEKTGYENLANLAGVTPEILFGDWILALLAARYNLAFDPRSPFRLPPVKIHPNGARVGTEVIHTFDSRRFLEESHQINWHRFNIPAASDKETLKIAPDAILFRRLIIPDDTPHTIRISLKSAKQATLFGFVARIK